MRKTQTEYSATRRALMREQGRCPCGGSLVRPAKNCAKCQASARDRRRKAAAELAEFRAAQQRRDAKVAGRVLREQMYAVVEADLKAKANKNGETLTKMVRVAGE